MALLSSLGLHFHFHKDAEAPTLTKAQLEKIFMKFDTNGDNCLSRAEMKKAFDYIGSNFPGFRATQALRYADANGDGQIDMKELDDLINFAHKIGYNMK
ncbi:hypothetical protein Tsubulata_041641 [Turnera subulata]|uniref:EF-hand domain-containing protein n=1 Tax=Turnera subulata TaxID=218843 RepID=A0A9Q0GHH7_9ROSI|nr:hypothetical protein Tsubulata_041641 [Turnera subulata]